jgi:hypothetical protein
MTTSPFDELRVRIVIFQALTPQGAHLRCLGSIPRAGRGTGKS